MAPNVISAAIRSVKMILWCAPRQKSFILNAFVARPAPDNWCRVSFLCLLKFIAKCRLLIAIALVLVKVMNLLCVMAAFCTARRTTMSLRSPPKAAWHPHPWRATTTISVRTTTITQPTAAITIPVNWAQCQVSCLENREEIKSFSKSLNQCNYLPDSGSESGSHKSIREKRPSGPSDGKPTRVRTVLNEKQLHTLRYFLELNSFFTLWQIE